MLDLSAVNTKYYEIKDKEGNLLTIKNPSQKFFTKIKSVLSMDEMEQFGMIYDIFRDILNLNTQGKEYSMEYVEQFDISTVGLVIEDYFTHVGEQLGK